MHLTRRAVLGAAATVGLAGCTDGNGDGATPTGTDDGATPTATDGEDETPTTSPANGMATVRVRSHDELGDVLVGPDGMTLYMFDQDEQGAGASTCSGGCADNWPPLTVEGEPAAGGDVTAELTTFEREDGTTQVAAAGWPLYHFAPDESPGGANGQGANDAWWVLRPDGTPVRSTGTPTGTETSGGGGY